MKTVLKPIKIYSTLDLLRFLRAILDNLLKMDLSKSKINEKRFYQEDVDFVCNLILGTYPERLIVSVLSFIAGRFNLPTGLLRPLWMKRMAFIRFCVLDGMTATAAAIRVGYSPRSAKKQGFRMIKRSSEICREAEAEERYARELKSRG